MNSLESIRSLLLEYLEEASTCRSEMENMRLLRSKEDFQQNVYEAFFNLIADPTQSPERSIHILNTFTCGLDGFFTNKSLQTLVGFACLEALARRRPEVLNGAWETLVWIIVNYSSFSNSALGTDGMSPRSFFKEANTETLKLITEFGSPELCPNPCLRLELFRFTRNFYEKLDYDLVACSNKVINTLFELCDNYKSLTLNQVPNFSPMDLNVVIEDNYINMKHIMNDSELKIKKTEIIAAVLKLTRYFALLEKEKYQGLNNQEIQYECWMFNRQLSACLCFCGLLPLLSDNRRPAPDSNYDLDHNDHDKCLLYLVQAVGNDSLLQNYVIDTLDTITQVSLCFPDNYDLQARVSRRKEKVLHRFFKGHINQLPTFQYKQEIYGGISQAKEYRLRYFQSDYRDLHIDSDNDSLENDSLENDSEEIDSEEIDSEENDSEENYFEIDIRD